MNDLPVKDEFDLLQDKQTIPAQLVPVHELFHIRHHEPVEAGKTLHAGNANHLQGCGMVEWTEEGYITTAKGRHIISKMIDHLAALKVVAYDFPHVTISDNK